MWKYLFAFMLMVHSISYAAIDQNSLKQDLRTIYHFHALDHKISFAMDGLTEYSLFSENAGQTWKMEVYDFSNQVGASYHKQQNEMMIVLEGEILVSIDDQQVTLLAGQYGLIPKGAIHVLKAGVEGTRFLLVHIPGFDYPKDRFYEKPVPEIVTKLEPTTNNSPFFIDQTIKLESKVQKKLDQFAPLDPKYYQVKVEDKDFIIYSIISSDATDNRWSLSIMELSNSDLKQVDMNGIARFIVLNGELKALVNDQEYVLTAGQSVRASSELAFAANSPKVRVLCINH